MTTTPETPLDRDQLLGLADRFLDALVARDPARLPTAPGVQFTENGQALPLGAGLWRTVRGRAAGGHHFADPAAGQVAFWGAVDEMGAPAILALRLRTQSGLVTEVETLVLRRSGWLFDPDGMVAPAPFLHEVLDAADRASRDDLVRVADRYFDGLERDDGSLIPVAAGCVRNENGVQTTSNPESAAADGAPWRALEIAEQITAGHFTYIETIRDRRYPVVDPERGLVLGHVVFDHPGDLQTADGRTPFTHPVSAVISEVFKVRAGQIVDVRAVVSFLPYGVRSVWDRPTTAAAAGPGAAGS
jgi:hypothetical protein